MRAGAPRSHAAQRTKRAARAPRARRDRGPYTRDERATHARQEAQLFLRVTTTAICGSDLHIYNGAFPQPKPLVLGHEFMGVVEEAAPEVKNLQRGDRVVVPFPIACGQRWFCSHLAYLAAPRCASPACGAAQLSRSASSSARAAYQS